MVGFNNARVILEIDDTLDLYKVINIEDLKEVYCNDDWYVICYENGNMETFNNSLDERANCEINSIFKNGKNYQKVL